MMYDNQILLIKKPKNWSSFDVVKKLRGVLRVKKIGHAGTLDPLATGLLIIGTGKQTKELHHYQSMAKQYEGIITIGKTTPSYDLGTPFDSESNYSHITQEQIKEAVKELTGRQEQTPPLYSALKVGGKRAYHLARKGEKIKLAARTITVEKFTITKIALPEIHFHIICSKGTYIRSIAHDLGKKLGVGGFLQLLVRTAIGEYQLQNAHTIEEIEKWVEKNNLTNQSTPELEKMT